MRTKKQKEATQRNWDLCRLAQARETYIYLERKYGTYSWANTGAVLINFDALKLKIKKNEEAT